jgi:hypothetical protein
LARVLQQIRSFSTMHTAELEGVARDLEAAGQADLAARLRVFLGLHTQETGLILDELADVRVELDRSAAAETPAIPAPPADAIQVDASARIDPAASSPKRARWLAEQAEHERQSAEQAQRPRSRREFFQRPQA